MINEGEEESAGLVTYVRYQPSLLTCRQAYIMLIHKRRVNKRGREERTAERVVKVRSPTSLSTSEDLSVLSFKLSMTAASYSLSVTVTDTLRSRSSCPAAFEATTHIDRSEDSTSVYG